MSDILVVLPPLTADDCVIFAKNADRPPTEVQEVVYFPAQDFPNGSKLQCTFIEIEQVPHTYSIVLSKPAWAWGAEMGANEHGVCVGNTSVWTKMCHPGDHEEKLIGCDFVRLALERSKSAREAVDVITSLLSAHGQGGICCEDHNFGQWTFQNSFVTSDRSEAWLIETAGNQWVAKKTSSGILTTSSLLTIGTDADLKSAGLNDHAETCGCWKSEDGDLNFAKAFSAEYPGISLSDKQRPENRLQCGKKLAENFSKEGKITVDQMFQVLRDEDSSINFTGELLTVGSQVSVVTPSTSAIPSCHWFTATPDPINSVFKPFIFCENVTVGNWTVSPSIGDKPRGTLQTSVDRRHPLYKAHEKGRSLMQSGSQAGQKLQTTMKNMEKQCVHEVSEFLKTFSQADLHEVKDLFQDITESEAKFYY